MRLVSRTKLGLIVVYVVMILTALIPFMTIYWARSIRTEIDHSTLLAEKFVGLLSLMQDVETGQRGFIITGREDFLEPYRGGIQRLEGARQTLRREMFANAESRVIMADLDGLINLKVEELAQTISLRRSFGFDAAARIVSGAVGQHYMEGIRKIIGKLIEAEDQHKITLLNELRRRETINAYVGFGAALSGLALLSALVVRLIRTMNARRHAEEEVKTERERLNVTLRAIDDAVITADTDTRITYINPAAEKLLGQELSQIRNHRFDEIVCLTNSHNSKPAANLVGQSLVHGTTFRRESACILHRPDGTVCYVTDVISPVVNSSGVLTYLVIVLRDATATIERSLALHHRATHDAMTELANRSEFQRCLNEVFGRANHLEIPAAVVAIDLDRFKGVNDLGGHAAGDAILCRVAEVLRAIVRPSDTIARLGGDEFAIILENCPPARSSAVAQQILTMLNPLEAEWLGSMYTTGASIGLAMLDPQFMSATAWLAAADQACFEAKRAGRGQLMNARLTQSKALPSS